jgi:hypothetical protein
MTSLAFLVLGERSQDPRAKVRSTRFERRSSLPVSAACVVANGVRETLNSLLGAPVGLRLFEPSIPSPQAWAVILENSRLYRLRGSVADAAIVLQTLDAAALAAALFGESPSLAERELSPIECDVIDRMVAAIAANLTAVCGKREGSSVERVAAIASFVTYFELLVEGPVSARIGVALSRDPAPERGPSLDVGHLAAIRLTTRAAIDVGAIEAAALVRIAVGTVLPIAEAAFHRCVLATDRRRLVRGSCGVQNGQYALFVDAA